MIILSDPAGLKSYVPPIGEDSCMYDPEKEVEWQFQRPEWGDAHVGLWWDWPRPQEKSTINSDLFGLCLVHAPRQSVGGRLHGVPWYLWHSRRDSMDGILEPLMRVGIGDRRS